MNNISVFVFLVVILMGFGYAAGNSRNFGFFKLVLLLVFIVPFMISLSISKTHLMVMLASFLVGYFLPYSYLLRPLSEGLSDFVNNIRYRDAYDDIRKKEEEIEELRRKYEKNQSRSNTNDERKEQAQQKHQRDYENFRQTQGNSGDGDESQSEQSDTQEFTKSPDARRNHYLKVLGLELELDREHSQTEIKKAFRRMAAKYHPDKHQGKPDAVVREMEARFREVVEAFEWLC